ncbi:MAG: Fe(2+)-trafficking protein [Gemmatales bacterium]|nr:Fe(2+)-trafficking protein [Gemmatales bacterium]MDW8386037.1 Fe(2+)-trafficking protein [Gemmatales bacterium]
MADSAQLERIAQFRKMANDDPENELGHFSLGKALMDAGEYAEAIGSFERTIVLNPQFSKAFQLLGTCYIKTGQRDLAIQTLKRGYKVASERGDTMPREEMARLLRELGEEPPTLERAGQETAAGVGGFRCQRPGCYSGSRAVQLPAPPMNDELGRQIYEKICADCWREWLAVGIKVINEMRLDLSDERAQQVYDNYMKEYLGLD